MSIKVFIKGQPEVTLGPANFVARGGEGEVYAHGGMGFKIYLDPARACPAGKITALHDVDDDSVILPQAPVFRAGRTPIHVGHTFRFIRDAWTLCQLFPRVFREREGLDAAKIGTIVQRMREAVAAVHRAKVLIVDLNEMNVLVSRSLAPYFIDADSYQVSSRYPATAIMDSVRDPKVRNNDFTTLSDWWSFAIVTFQMWIGIHPFKGKHPSLKTLEDRMRNGVSVFDPLVSVPKVCYPLDVIPASYRAWYRALFVDGKRLPPPATVEGGPVAVSPARPMPSAAVLEIVELQVFEAPIRHVDGDCVHFGDFVQHGRSGQKLLAASRRVFGVTNTLEPVAACIVAAELVVQTLTHGGQVATAGIAADEIASYRGTLYVRRRDKVSELTVRRMADGRLYVASVLVFDVLEHASHLFEGGVLQDILGEPYVTIFPQPGRGYQVHLPELRRHKVLQAKFDSGVLMVLAGDGARYHRYVFRFDEDFQTYDVRERHDVAPTDLNFVVLDTGIYVCLNEDEELELFQARPRSQATRIVRDAAIGADMRLYKDGGVRFYRGTKTYSMRMK